VAKVLNVREAKAHSLSIFVRVPGTARGRFTMKKNFDAPLPAKDRRFFFGS
jgi:hypothetical protein